MHDRFFSANEQKNIYINVAGSDVELDKMTFFQLWANFSSFFFFSLFILFLFLAALPFGQPERLWPEQPQFTQ